jgi:hypothetical protein
MSAASWITFVRYVAKASRFLRLHSWWRVVYTSLLISVLSFKCVENPSQSAFFQFHFSLVKGSICSSLSDVRSKWMTSWSKEVRLTSSMAQLLISDVTTAVEKVRSITDDPLL